MDLMRLLIVGTLLAILVSLGVALWAPAEAAHTADKTTTTAAVIKMCLSMVLFISPSPIRGMGCQGSAVRSSVVPGDVTVG